MASSGPSASDTTSSAKRPLEDLSMSVKGSSPTASPTKDSELQLAIFAPPESWKAPPPTLAAVAASQSLSHQLKTNRAKVLLPGEVEDRPDLPSLPWFRSSSGPLPGEASDRMEVMDPGMSIKGLSSASRSGPAPPCEPSFPLDASEESDPEGSHPCARFSHQQQTEQQPEPHQTHQF